jgi:hypothetical protein
MVPATQQRPKRQVHTPARGDDLIGATNFRSHFESYIKSSALNVVSLRPTTTTTACKDALHGNPKYTEARRGGRGAR